MQPGQTERIGFDENIKPLFREKDRAAMIKAFDLWNYEDVVKNASAIAHALSSGAMPCDGAWPPERVALLQRWVEAGTPR